MFQDELDAQALAAKSDKVLVADGRGAAEADDPGRRVE
jgi:hypothetical protein